jgi:hypothetical protein
MGAAKAVAPDAGGAAVGAAKRRGGGEPGETSEAMRFMESGHHAAVRKKKKNNGKHAVKKYLRTGVKAIVFLVLAGVAVWYGLVLLLVNRAD